LLTTEGWRRGIRVRASNGLSRYSVGNQWLIPIDCHARGITTTYVAARQRLRRDSAPAGGAVGRSVDSV
jgi:hypothetical protein